MKAAPWLVVIDMQEVLDDPGGEWFTPGFPSIEPTVARMVAGFGERVVFRRFVAPRYPSGAWGTYYELWPFALVPDTDRLYDSLPAFGGSGDAVATQTPFSAWADEPTRIIPLDADVVPVGFSSGGCVFSADCCVLSIALPAADAGHHVLVVTDACAGLIDTDHHRALDAMKLYAPLIELTTADAFLVSERAWGARDELGGGRVECSVAERGVAARAAAELGVAERGGAAAAAAAGGAAEPGGAVGDFRGGDAAWDLAAGNGPDGGAPAAGDISADANSSGAPAVGGRIAAGQSAG